MSKHPFELFLQTFIPKIEKKTKQLYKVLWILETTGSKDAADLKTELDTELRILFSDKEQYNNLLSWDKDASITDPLIKRELNVLIRAFAPNILPENLIRDIAQKESDLLLTYSSFRPFLNGKSVSENEIREILKNEIDPVVRKQAWEASKEVGMLMAPQILSVVKLRNDAATHLGYQNYFEMQLALQEVDESWLFALLNEVTEQSNDAYDKMIANINQHLSNKFGVEEKDLGPWAWSEPFCQEDPLDRNEHDKLVKNIDICEESVKFYKRMGIDVQPVLKHSDMFERVGKTQHAFCINIDRQTDVRTLNNVNATLKWLETVLHEFGHAIYELGFDATLPWLLREAPHNITTEAMALIAGRQAYKTGTLKQLSSYSKAQDFLIQQAEESLKRRQLIFSRWVLVMTFFERELYRNPNQDLNALWWSLVHKYQKITPPNNREGKCDWAAKSHMGLAPVYYYSYLLGEMFASSIEEALLATTGSTEIANSKAGTFLNEKLFRPGNSLHWLELVRNVTGEPLTANAWIRQFT